MILIPTRVGPSPIHGQGLFTREAVAAGTPIWRFETGFDRAFSPEQFAALPSMARDHTRWYSYVSPGEGHYVLSGDHGCFMNHAADPNTGAPPGTAAPVITIALRDLAAGEELTCDYRAFDTDADAKLRAE